jgi:hypothetical protein
MEQARLYRLIIERLVTAPGHRATTSEICDAVARGGMVNDRHPCLGATHTDADWRAAVRDAMHFLRGKGVIRALDGDAWELGEADCPPWAVAGVQPRPMARGRGGAVPSAALVLT